VSTRPLSCRCLPRGHSDFDPAASPRPACAALALRPPPRFLRFADRCSSPQTRPGPDHIGCHLTHLSLGRIWCYERPRWSHDGRTTRGAHYHEQRADSRQRGQRHRHSSTRDSREGRAATTLARDHPHTATRGRGAVPSHPSWACHSCGDHGGSSARTHDNHGRPNRCR